jgi:hypothetical protein
MKALAYKTNRSAVRGWEQLHKQQPLGYAYETETQFVHVYGINSGLWVISPGLTVSVKKHDTLLDWVTREFGAADIQRTILDVGQSVSGVWRPGIYYDDNMLTGLEQTNSDLRLAEQRLLLLMQRLDELLLFVEPTSTSLAVFSHKSRELLILACTAIEAQWRYFLELAGVAAPPHGFRTSDYVKLRSPLFLEEFQVAFPRYDAIEPVRPFHSWDNQKPTQSISWYNAYNEAKHDGLSQLSSATLLACIEAVAANIALFSVRFGPHRLYGGGGMLAAAVMSTAVVSLVDPDVRTFYVPNLDVAGRGGALTWGSATPLSPKPEKFKL